MRGCKGIICLKIYLDLHDDFHCLKESWLWGGVGPVPSAGRLLVAAGFPIANRHFIPVCSGVSVPGDSPDKQVKQHADKDVRATSYKQVLICTPPSE